MCVFVTSSWSEASRRDLPFPDLGQTPSGSNSKAALEETVNDYFRRWQGVLPSAPPWRTGG